MKILLLVCIIICPFVSAAQVDSTSSVIRTLRKLSVTESEKSIKKYNEEKTASRQRATLQYIQVFNQQAKIFLKRGIDTIAFNRFLADVKHSLTLVKDGILVNKGTNQTQRNLDVSSAILNELYARVSSRKQLLQNYSARITALSFQIDSLSSDPSLYAFPEDSAGAVKVIKRLYVTAVAVSPVDSALEKAAGIVEEQQLKTDLLLFDINSTREDMEIYSGHLSSQSFQQEFPFIWQDPIFSRPLSDILRFSIAKEMMLLRFYAEDHLLRIFFMLFLLAGAWYFLYSLKKQIQASSYSNTSTLVITHPVATALLITFSIFQFLFAAPPFIFSFILWVVSAISLGIIFKGYISAYWQRFWTIATLLFILAGIDNIILQASRPERYFMLAVSVGGSIFMATLLINKKRSELRERKILYFIVIFLLFEISASLLNILGRFNMAKAFMISGYVSLIMGIVFLWAIRLINEGLVLASGVYKQPSRQLFYLNFNRVGQKAPAIFYIILALGWVLIVARHFYHLRGYAASVNNFVTMEQSIGDYRYSIAGISIFIFVLLCSVFLSKLVSYFAAEHDIPNNAENTRKKFSPGSWLLVIRIFIITAGLILAFAAAGIPIDKFVIVLGALGVGVGLGLQGLVNNLVSGLIISFEKPVTVGDVIEFNGQFATVKSIGFRSSIAKSIDGANLIIPNGDLLSQQLTNWTMGNNFRRCHLMVGVAYATDINLARTLLLDLFKGDERILAYPAPGVFFKDFGDSAIEIELIYWIRDIKEYLPVRSELIMKISEAFKNAGITIPFPQQDVYIKKETGSRDDK